MARHEWQQVMMNPTLERVQAFEAKYSQQNTSGSPDGVGAQSSSGAPESAAPSNSAPPPEEGTASPYDEGFTPEALELFREHGTHPYLVAALEPGYNRFYDRIAALPEAERQTAIDASEAEVVRQVYRDDEHALKAGLKEIEQAAKRLGLDINEINESGALADPDTHREALILARMVLGSKKP
jgi:hypothetical protein